MPIVFEQVSYSYSSSSSNGQDLEYALRDIDLTVPDGSFFAIIGHTGSGKSTLIQHINGLLAPTEGRVLVDGQDVNESRAIRRQVRSKVGIVFQYPEYQLFGNTVAEDVGFGPRHQGLPTALISDRVDRALEKVGLDPAQVKEKSPFDFSGGQKRRIAFAGVLAMDPQYLVLDEPMAGLDPKGRIEIMGYIRSLHDEGMTIIMVSHSMDDVADFADSVLVLKSGSIFMQGSPDEVFAHGEELRRIGLTIPVTTKIARDLGNAGFSFSKTCFTLDELADEIALQLGGYALPVHTEDGEVYG